MKNVFTFEEYVRLFGEGNIAEITNGLFSTFSELNEFIIKNHNEYLLPVSVWLDAIGNSIDIIYKVVFKDTFEIGLIKLRIFNNQSISFHCDYYTTLRDIVSENNLFYQPNDFEKSVITYEYYHFKDYKHDIYSIKENMLKFCEDTVKDLNNIENYIREKCRNFLYDEDREYDEYPNTQDNNIIPIKDRQWISLNVFPKEEGVKNETSI